METQYSHTPSYIDTDRAGERENEAKALTCKGGCECVELSSEAVEAIEGCLIMTLGLVLLLPLAGGAGLGSVVAICGCCCWLPLPLGEGPVWWRREVVVSKLQ